MSPKLSMIINIVAAVLMVTVASSADLTAVFGQSVATLIIHICAYLGAVVAAVNAVMHGFSSSQPGTLVQN